MKIHHNHPQKVGDSGKTTAKSPFARLLARTAALPYEIRDEVRRLLFDMYAYRNLDGDDTCIYRTIDELTVLACRNREIIAFAAETLNDLPNDVYAAPFVEGLALVLRDVRDMRFGCLVGQVITGIAKHLSWQEDTISDSLSEIGHNHPVRVTKALYRAVQLDPRIWQTAVKVLTSIGVKPEFIREKWLQSRYIGPRAAAIRYLADFPESAAWLPTMAISMMADSIPILRCAAVDTICHLGYEMELKSMLLAATNDHDGMVCQTAIEGIAANRSWAEALTFELAEMLRNHASATVRSYAAQALGNSGERALCVISDIRAAKHDKEDRVRGQAARTLAKLKACRVAS